MAKLTKEQVNAIKSLGIEVTAKTTEEQARPLLEEFLKARDVEDLEEETLQELIEMADLLNADSEEEMDELADEDDEDADDEDGDEEEEDEDEEEEDEDEEEEEEPAPKKKAPAKKSAPAPAKKKKSAPVEEEDEDEDEDEEEEEEEAPKKSTKKKEAAKPAPKKTTKPAAKGKRAEKVNPRENEAHAKMYEPLFSAIKKVLPKGITLEHNFLVNGGVSIKVVGKNATKVLLSYDTAKMVEGEIHANVIIPTIKDKEKFEGLFPDDIEIQKTWNGGWWAKNMSITDTIEVINDNKEFILEIVDSMGKNDKKLGENRKKMEDDLNANKKAAIDAKKKKKAAPVVEEEDEDEEEEETPAPKKKSAPAKTSKKPAKKVVEVEEDDEDEEEEEEEVKPTPKKKTAPAKKKK